MPSSCNDHSPPLPVWIASETASMSNKGLLDPLRLLLMTNENRFRVFQPRVRRNEVENCSGAVALFERIIRSILQDLGNRRHPQVLHHKQHINFCTVNCLTAAPEAHE